MSPVENIALASLFNDKSLRMAGQRQQALYCMKRAVAVDPSDVNLLWEQAMMAKEFGEDEIASLPNRELMSIAD